MKLLKWFVVIIIGLAVLGALAGNTGVRGRATSFYGDEATPTAAMGQHGTQSLEPLATDMPTQTPAATQTPEPTATAVPVIAVDILTLAEQYDGNKLRAQAYYKDRVIETSGVASDVSQDILGSYYVSLQPGGDYYGLTQVQCFVSDQDQLIAITNGHRITVRGRVDDMSLGIIPLKDCQVVP